MKAIKNDDVIDVIYDSWYGLPLDKADKVVYDYTQGKLIPVEWIEKRIDSYIRFYKEKEKREPALALSISHAINAISELLDDWREENEI